MKCLPLLAVGRFLPMPRLDIVMRNIGIWRLEAEEVHYVVAQH